MYKGHKDVDQISNSFVITLVRYFTMDMGKAEFVQNIWKLQEVLGVSDKLYDGLVDYFGSKIDAIVLPILPSLENL